MKIIKVIDDTRVIVQFQDQFKAEKENFYHNFNIGQIKNPYDKTVCDIGYVGEGIYNTTEQDGKLTRAYVTWHDLIVRCYKEEIRHKHIAYINCDVCEEWHNFQNFAKWYYENYYEINEGRLHLDKDIIFKENYLYAPERCLFVPQRINMIFMQKPNKYGLPSGISLQATGKYRSNYNGKSLGNYKTLEQAVLAHDNAMRIHIRNVANEYRNKIPKKVYNALLNY